MCWLWRFCVVNGAGNPSRLRVFVWEFTICRAVQAKGHYLHGSTFSCHPGHGWQKVLSQTPSTQEAACDKHLRLHNLIFFGFPSLCRCQIHCRRCLPYSCHQSIVTKVRHFSKASKILFLHSFLTLTNPKLNTSPKFCWGVNLGELSRFDWCKSSRGNLESLCKPFYCHPHTPNSSSSNYLLLHTIGVQTLKTTGLCQVQSDDVSQCSKATPFAVRIRCGSFLCDTGLLVDDGYAVWQRQWWVQRGCLWCQAIMEKIRVYCYYKLRQIALAILCSSKQLKVEVERSVACSVQLFPASFSYGTCWDNLCQFDSLCREWGLCTVNQSSVKAWQVHNGNLKLHLVTAVCWLRSMFLGHATLKCRWHWPDIPLFEAQISLRAIQMFTSLVSSNNLTVNS